MKNNFKFRVNDDIFDEMLYSASVMNEEVVVSWDDGINVGSAEYSIEDVEHYLKEKVWIED